MNKLLKIIILFLVVTILAGCTNSDINSNKNETTDRTENNENRNKNKVSQSNNEDNEMEKNEEEAQTKTKEKEISKTISPVYEVNDQWSVVPIDNENEKVVLLTIDDAPDKYGLKMAQTLKELDAPAIFFVNGHFLTTSEKKEELKEIHDMGFAIGNHTFNHAFLPELSDEKQRDEIIELNDLIEDVLGERPKFFRAPNGANTDYTKEIAAEENMILMNWTYGYDWEADYQTKEAITDIMLHTELLTDGANLLMHDREWTAEALADIVTGLREQGYELVNPKLIKTK